jgi:hypothetical protein
VSAHDAEPSHVDKWPVRRRTKVRRPVFAANICTTIQKNTLIIGIRHGTEGTDERNNGHDRLEAFGILRVLTLLLHHPETVSDSGLAALGSGAAADQCRPRGLCAAPGGLGSCCRVRQHELTRQSY